ncbi:hypothetical protein POM88_001396 [Heracleum sosnowskyi]|uniref:GTP-eEF1A C-terminal domain-containing protein n=1 Tax=Heracleum sosnowskyi TaxID=360622 RepID=A0AAD8NAT4_9APIA|nr:hypothetical protein POM88_001396 [Heracleum sosnowskyi]
MFGARDESDFPLNSASLQHWRLACVIMLQRISGDANKEFDIFGAREESDFPLNSASLQHWRLACAILLQRFRPKIALKVWLFEKSVKALSLQAIKGTRVKSGDVLCHPDFSVAVPNYLKLKILVLDVTTPILSGSELEFHLLYAKEAARAVKILSLLDSKTGKVTEKAPQCALSKQSAVLEVKLEGLLLRFLKSFSMADGVSPNSNMSVPIYFQPYVVASHGPVHTKSGGLNYVVNTLLSLHMVIAFLVAVILDNTVPGSRQERGVYVWSESDAAKTEAAVAKDNELPFRVEKIFRWVKWVGV